MTTALSEPAKPQFLHLIAALVVAAGIFGHILSTSSLRGGVFLIGLFAGFALYHAAFGFTGAYRNAIVRKDMSDVAAHAIMLVVAMLLFAPILADGEVFGHRAGGAVAPVSIAMLFGAFLFGLGMQLGGGCASGTLFTAGGGNFRMILVLIFFCVGSWWGTLDMDWWRSLPSFGAVSLGARYGYGLAVVMQIAMLAAILWTLWHLGLRLKKPLFPRHLGGQPWWRLLIKGPWPLVLGALSLALVNWGMLAVTGHPWGVTWGFTLWAAKAMTFTGWEASSSPYWSEAWRQKALAAPFFADHTTISNIGIILGAAAASALSGNLRRPMAIPLRSSAAAVLGGLMLGYGARLAYGCNIGAFFSGVASTSLHGWAWIIMAIAGTWLGVYIRPYFRLAN